MTWRISAAIRGIRCHTGQVTIPLQVLLQWDDEENDRQMALDLFDAFGSTEKTLHAIWAGTPASRRSRRTPRPSSSPGA
jgi:hypothetical protein